MKTFHHLAASSRLQRNGWGQRTSRLERFLHFLGADPSFVDAVLGDLAEERAARAATDGARSARRWYLREVFRSAPHLVASAVRGTEGRRRALLVLGFGAIALFTTLALKIALDLRAPALLTAAGDRGDGVVVNNVKPVQLSMRVLDARGRVLPDTGVRYRWLSGAPISVSPRGVTRCTSAGDAVVRASLGNLATQLVLRCRPVHGLRTLGMMDLILGDSGAKVTFEAVDAHGNQVSLLRGEIGVEDSSVATLARAADGTRIVRPRAPGTTYLNVHIGDEARGAAVNVFERARTVEGIRRGQHLAVPVTLDVGELQQWQIPGGLEPYSLRVLPDGDAHVPRLAIVGANCVDDFGTEGLYCITLHGATVFVYHSRDGDQERAERGMLAVWRHLKP